MAQTPGPDQCENCRAAVGKIFDHLAGPSIDSIIGVLDSAVCKQDEHPGDCIEVPNTWWPVIAKLIYNPTAAGIVCEDITDGECKPER